MYLGCDCLGTFNHVNYEMDCPACGTRLKDFQTKDGNCILRLIEFDEVEQFYDCCSKCDIRVQFDRKNDRELDKKEKYTIGDYELTTKTREEREKEWGARKKEIKENECTYCKGTGEKLTDMKYESVEEYMKEWGMDNGQMMAQILNQEIYCDSGRLKHLIDDKKMELFIKNLDSCKE